MERVFAGGGCVEDGALSSAHGHLVMSSCVIWFDVPGASSAVSAIALRPVGHLRLRSCAQLVAQAALL